MARILVVEDEVELLNVWAEWLQHLGNTVQTAADGVEAIKQIGSSVFDLIVFDLNLPRLNGLEAIKRIRRTNPDLLLLAVTGKNEPALVRAVVEAGANEILFKPVSLDELAEAVARIARQKFKD